MSVLVALAKLAARRPLAVVLVAVALGVGGAALALTLSPTAASGTFVESSSSTYGATQRFYSRFGEEPVEVLVKGNLQRMLLSSDIVRLVGLEGCLSGRTPSTALASEGGANGPCGQLARLHAVKSVLGPGTFLSEAAMKIDSVLRQKRSQAESLASEGSRELRSRALKAGRSEAEANALAQEASKAIMTGYAAEVTSLGLRYGLDSVPSLTDANFVSTTVFDSSATVPGTPKQRFAYLFPSREAALISVRLRSGLSESRRDSALAAIRRAVAMPQWRLQHGERYLLTGEPLIVSELTGSISSSVLTLLLAVAGLMALALSLVFRGRPRLLPLASAALAVALTFGALALCGATLSVAEVAVLPVLTGLAVDYAIQLHSRAAEALESGEGDVAHAVAAAVRAGGPSIAAAAAASAAAVLVLELSPVPTVRGFALLLAAGLAIALLCALLVGTAAIVLSVRLRERRAATGSQRGSAARLRARSRALSSPSLGAMAASWRGAQDLLLDNRATRWASAVALERAVRRPWAALGVGLLLAAVGWGLVGATPVQTDITKLVPQEMPSLRNLATLERLSGVGGQIDLMVSGSNVVKPASIEWMSSYEREMLTRFGDGPKGGGCGSARLCSAFSLPSIFEGSTGAGAGSGAKLSSADVNGLLAEIPSYFSEDVISRDRRVASLAFGVRLMPLASQQRMVEAMKASLNPPPGLHAQLVGLPVLAAQADSAVASPSWRAIELLLGLAAVAAVLMIAFRGDLRRALLPLVPVALATGWSALVLFLVQVPLNPMSVTLGALVIAVATEFSVLLSERHFAELSAGRSPQEALRTAYSRTGAAVAASGVTAIVGFGALAFSEIAMLRDFGIVTLIDLAISLAGVMLMLPVALTLADRMSPSGLALRRRRKRSGAGGALARGARPGHEHSS